MPSSYYMLLSYFMRDAILYIYIICTCNCHLLCVCDTYLWNFCMVILQIKWLYISLIFVFCNALWPATGQIVCLPSLKNNMMYESYFRPTLIRIESVFFVCIQDLHMVITVLVDGLAPIGATPSAGTVPKFEIYPIFKFPWLSATQWASYQIRKIAGCACAGNAGNVFPATDCNENR